MKLVRRWAFAITGLALVVGCGGTPVKLQVGDTVLEVGEATPPAEQAPMAPEPGGASKAPAPQTADAAAAAPATAPQPVHTGPAQIQISTGRAIAPEVDGKAMVATTDGHVAEVAPGKRTVVVRNLLGREKARKVVQVRPGTRHVYTWDGRALSPAGSRGTSRIEPVRLKGTLEVKGLLVADQSATVSVAGQPAVRQQDGSFRREGVPFGEQHVHIAAGGFDLYDGGIFVQAGGTTRCGFTLGSGAWVPDCKHYP